MNLLEFYSSLPTPDQVPTFYVPYYTESLTTFTGVRVIPDESFCSGLSEDYLKYVLSVGFPCYFIPIHSHNCCYGFVVKGQHKKTPRYCSNFFLPGVESLRKNKPVVFVEGIKDAYLLRSSGIPCIPMLTAQITKDFLSYLKVMQCHVIYVPDHDSHREDFINRSTPQFADLPYSIYLLEEVKDLGDYFTPGLREAALREAKRIIKLYRRIESYGKL